VDILGVLASHHGQAYHGVPVDAYQAAGLPHPTALLQVLQDRQRFVLGELAAVQGGAFAFGAALLAGAAGEDAALLVGAIAKADTQIVAATLAIVGAVGVLAAEVFQVVHDASSQSRARGNVDEQLEPA